MSTLTSAGSVSSTATTAESDDAVHRHPVVVELRPVLAAGHGTVAAEREEHPGRARHAGDGAEELADRRDQQHDAAHVRRQRLAEDHLRRAPPPAVTPASSCTANRNASSRIQPPMRGVEDRAPDALGRRVGRAVRLLGQVGRRVVPGDRVLRQDRRQRQDAEAGSRCRCVCPPKNPVLFTVCVKTALTTLAWWLGHEDQDQRRPTAAPATCHHTEMLFRIASRWLEKMFTSAASTSTTRKMRNTRVRL